VVVTKINSVHYIAEPIARYGGPTAKAICNGCKGLHVKKQLLGQEIVTMNIPSGLQQSNEAETEFLALLQLIVRLYTSLFISLCLTTCS